MNRGNIARSTIRTSKHLPLPRPSPLTLDLNPTKGKASFRKVYTVENMALLRSCCCFTNVRTGSFASGIYTLILALINGGLMGFNLHTLHEQQDTATTFPSDPDEVPEEFQNINITEESLQLGSITNLLAWMYTTLALCVLQFFTSILLVAAIHMDKRQLVLPWIAVMISMIVLDTAVLVYQCVGSGLLTFNIIQMVIWLALTLLNIYCILCVVSQYQELKAGRGTLDYIRQQQVAVLYRAGGIQQVHLHQGPIYMGSNGRVTMSAHPLLNDYRSPTPLQLPDITTTMMVSPPEYHIAASRVPRYSAVQREPRTHLESIAEVEDDLSEDALLTEEEKERNKGKQSPPPPYTP